MSASDPDTHVLVIDGEEDAAEQIGGLIRKAGYKTLISHSAWRGIRMADKLQPQAIILELKLSRLDGFEVLKRLKETPRTGNIPVIILSGTSDQATRLRALEMGADDYLAKPFDKRELVLRLKAVMRRHQPVVQSLSVGDLELDPIAMRARIKGRPVELALIEFKLLSVLMTRPGQIIPREEMLEIVWGKETGVDIRSVDTYVYRVRSKLGEVGSMMKTVRGRGYVFQNPNP